MRYSDHDWEIFYFQYFNSISIVCMQYSAGNTIYNKSTTYEEREVRISRENPVRGVGSWSALHERGFLIFVE